MLFPQISAALGRRAPRPGAIRRVRCGAQRRKTRRVKRRISTANASSFCGKAMHRSYSAAPPTRTAAPEASRQRKEADASGQRAQCRRCGVGVTSELGYRNHHSLTVRIIDAKARTAARPVHPAAASRNSQRIWPRTQPTAMHVINLAVCISLRFSR